MAGTRLIGFSAGALVAIAATLGSAANAFAEEPRSTSATYGAWTLRCVTPPAQQPAPSKDATKPPAAQGAARQCEIVESLQVQGQQAPIVQIAVGAPQKNGPLLLVVQVPIGAWLPAGVTVQIGDKGAPLPLIYKRCLPSACVADTQLSDVLRDAMKAQPGKGLVTFRITPDQDTVVPISFNGFAAAFDAMRQAAKR